MDNLKNQALRVYEDLTLHWKKPAKGNYVSYKELLFLGLGGMGQNFVVQLTMYMGLSASNTLFGSAIGISPTHLYTMNMIQTVFGIFFTIIRSKMLDNTKTRLGRFRPYIAIMGFPLIAITAIFLFLDFNGMAYTERLVAVFSFSLAVSMLSPLFRDPYDTMPSVMTSNATERTKVILINTMIFSIAPTITNSLVPILVPLTGGYTNYNTYRYIILPIAILGVGLNLFTAFGCKERIITAADYTPRVPLFKSSLEIMKNKYWWILNLAAIIGFTEGAYGVLLSWLFIYGSQDMALYSFYLLILGSAASIGMLVTPMIMKKIGNKGTLFLHNGTNIFFLIMMTVCYKQPTLFFVFYYLNTVINSLALIYNAELFSEMKDYQQYLSRKRMDSTFSTAGLLWMPISLLTGWLIPYVYECFGLTTNYNILYEPQVRNSLFYIICAMAVLGAVLNLIPYAFFSLSRFKHGEIIKVLKLRAYAENCANGKETPQEICEIVEAVMASENVRSAELSDLAVLKAEWKSPGLSKSEKSEKRDTYRAAKVLAKHKQEVQLFFDEFESFTSEKGREKVAICERLTAIDLTALPGANVAEFICDVKENRKFTKAIQKMILKISEKYPDGITEDYRANLERASNMPSATSQERSARTSAMRLAYKQLDQYQTVFAPYFEAEKTLATRSVYTQFDQTTDKYESACQQVKEAQEKEREAEQKANTGKEQEKEQQLQERFEGYSEKKQNRIRTKQEKKSLKKGEKEGKDDE